MKHVDGTFRGYQDLSLYWQSWLPNEAPRAILLVVHGLAEHCGRYMNLVNYFVPRGYAVYGFDQRGHGKSEGLRGYVERFSDYIDDLESFCDFVRRRHDSTSIFLVGHSMGGTIAAAYITDHQDRTAGLIASAVVLKLGSSVSPLSIKMARLLSMIAPKVGVSVIDASTISRDQAVVNAYVNDLLVYRGKTRARLGAELLNTMEKLPSRLEKITVPIIIMYGSCDRLCNPEGSHILYERVASKDRTLKIYEDMYHEIFNEPEHKQVMADMEEWLDVHA
jgi:alpha-beta hydrolase superfamily lysophospholipase